MKKFNKSIVLTIIALTMVFVLAVGVCFSWIEGGYKGYVKGGDITISTGSNLTIRNDQGLVADSINISCEGLQEVSSADGKAFYIPTENNKTNTQSQMTFREGTPADENTKYLSVDFQIEAGDSKTDIYLGAGTMIRCSDVAINNALRMAFYKNDGSKSIVFKPAQMPGLTDERLITYSPIIAIDNNGSVLSEKGTTVVTTDAYAKYYFQGDEEGKSTPIFTLEPDERLNVTLILWLEGTEINTKILEKNIDIEIEFTTKSDDLIKYTFIDNCHNTNGFDTNGKYENHWVHNKGTVNNESYETMMYLYDYTSDRYYSLSKVNETTWSGYISTSVTNFVFRRYSVSNNTYWNEWEPSITNIPTYDNKGVTERTFVAISGNPTRSEGTEIRGCYGYWKDNKDTIRIYFQNRCEWNDLRIYAWTSNGDHPDTGEFPGKNMDIVKDGSNIYYFDLSNGSKIQGIKFSNGPDGTIVYIASDMYCYGTTYGYMWYNSGSYFLGSYPGSNISWDQGKSMHKVSIRVGEDLHNGNTKPSKSGLPFSFLTTNNYDVGKEEKSASNQGQIGKSYTFSNYTLTEREDLNYEFKNTQTFFNGSVFSYLNNNDIKYWVYTDPENSTIYPVNQAATDNN